MRTDRPIKHEPKVVVVVVVVAAAVAVAAPCGLWVERTDPLRFLAGCRKRRLMEAVSLVLNFFGVCLVPFILPALMTLHYIVFVYVLSLHCFG